MRHRLPVTRLFVASTLATIALLSGCSAVSDAAPSDVAVPSGNSAPLQVSAPAEFLGGDTPGPESTISPAPNSWADAVVPEGYRVVALAVAADPTADAVLASVSEWADAHGVRLEATTVADADELEKAVVQAAESDIDLVIGAGPQTVDVFSLVTSQFLDRQFLMLAGQLPEPTANVTAVIWPGAGFRGTGITPDGDAEAEAVTSQRASEAVRAGYASVAWGVTGIVVRLP